MGRLRARDMSLIKQFIIRMVDADPNVTTKQIVQAAEEELGHRYTIKYVRTLRNELGLGVK